MFIRQKLAYTTSESGFKYIPWLYTTTLDYKNNNSWVTECHVRHTGMNIHVYTLPPIMPSTRTFEATSSQVICPHFVKIKNIKKKKKNKLEELSSYPLPALPFEETSQTSRWGDFPLALDTVSFTQFYPLLLVPILGYFSKSYFPLLPFNYFKITINSAFFFSLHSTASTY